MGRNNTKYCFYVCRKISIHTLLPAVKHILDSQREKSVSISIPPICSGSCLAAVQRAIAETDVAAVLPLGRQHSLLNIINVVIHKLGHLIHIYLPKVLQILLCVTASVSTILDSREQVTGIEVDTRICSVDF